MEVLLQCGGGSYDIRMTSQIAVSSAKVPTVTFGACGRSEVNKMYSRGPKTLP